MPSARAGESTGPALRDAHLCNVSDLLSTRRLRSGRPIGGLDYSLVNVPRTGPSILDYLTSESSSTNHPTDTSPYHLFCQQSTNEVNLYYQSSALGYSLDPIRSSRYMAPLTNPAQPSGSAMRRQLTVQLVQLRDMSSHDSLPALRLSHGPPPKKLDTRIAYSGMRYRGEERRRCPTPISPDSN